jgi:hypothetical protein
MCGCVVYELTDRRNLQQVFLKPLERSSCRSIVESFIKKTVQAESSSMAGGAFLTDNTPGAVSAGGGGGGGGGGDSSSSDIAGFLLFDIQINDIVTHRLASTPLFLRVVLR